MTSFATTPAQGSQIDIVSDTWYHSQEDLTSEGEFEHDDDMGDLSGG